MLNMVHRSHDDQLPRSTCNTKYLTHTQMVHRSATHHERMRHLRLVVMNQKAKLLRLCNTVDDYNRLNLVLSQNNVPRFRALMEPHRLAISRIAVVTRKSCLSFRAQNVKRGSLVLSRVCRSDAEVLFDIDLSRVRSGATQSEEPSVVCDICAMIVKCKEMRHHITAHLLFDTSWSVDQRPAFPCCGLCGVRAVEPYVHIGSFAGRGLPSSFDNQWYCQANWPM